MSKWITRADIAADAGVSEKTVKRWEQAGLIVAHRFGPRCVRYDSAQVAAALVGA